MSQFSIQSWSCSLIQACRSFSIFFQPLPDRLRPVQSYCIIPLQLCGIKSCSGLLSPACCLQQIADVESALTESIGRCNVSVKQRQLQLHTKEAKAENPCKALVEVFSLNLEQTMTF